MKIKIQKPYSTSKRYNQSYPIVSFVYYLKCRWSTSDKPYTTKKSMFDPHMTQGGKMKIPNPYCTTSTVSANHVPSYPRISIVLKNVDAFQFYLL